MRLRTIAVLAILCVAASVLLIGGSIFAQGKVYKKGDKIADFTLPDINKKKVKLSQFRGKPILINVFAYW